MKQHGDIKFNGKANYRITVQGKLDKNWSGQLGGMSITNEILGGEVETSTLFGEIADQAALSGILNALYDMHLPVLTVKCEGVNPDGKKRYIKQ